MQHASVRGEPVRTDPWWITSGSLSPESSWRRSAVHRRHARIPWVILTRHGIDYGRSASSSMSRADQPDPSDPHPAPCWSDPEVPVTVRGAGAAIPSPGAYRRLPCVEHHRGLSGRPASFADGDVGMPKTTSQYIRVSSWLRDRQASLVVVTVRRPGDRSHYEAVPLVPPAPVCASRTDQRHPVQPTQQSIVLPRSLLWHSVRQLGRSRHEVAGYAVDPFPLTAGTCGYGQRREAVIRDREVSPLRSDEEAS